MLGPTALFFTHISVAGHLCARRCIPSRPTCSQTLWWRPYSLSGDHYILGSYWNRCFGSGLVPHSIGSVYSNPDWAFRSGSGSTKAKMAHVDNCKKVDKTIISDQ